MNLGNDVTEKYLKRSQEAVSDIAILRNKLNQRAEKISFLVSDFGNSVDTKLKKDFKLPEDIKQLLQGAIDYAKLLGKVSGALLAESEGLEDLSKSIRAGEGEVEKLLYELEVKVVCARRMVKRVEKDIQISFSRYEHCFRVQKRFFGFV